MPTINQDRYTVQPRSDGRYTILCISDEATEVLDVVSSKEEAIKIARRHKLSMTLVEEPKPYKEPSPYKGCHRTDTSKPLCKCGEERPEMFFPSRPYQCKTCRKPIAMTWAGRPIIMARANERKRAKYHDPITGPETRVAAQIRKQRMNERRVAAGLGKK